MKVILISTDENPAAMGIKAVSSNLKKNGFETILIIMANWDDNFKSFSWEALQAICKDAVLIGLSCMTHGVKKALEVKNKLAQSGIDSPFIIGGIHATLDPESLINDFDFVCNGEGEDLIVELAGRLNGHQPYADIPGLWGRKNGSVFRNHPQPLNKDLSDYPYPDYDLGHQLILESDELVPMGLGHIVCDYFEVMGSRGYPHNCAYCSNEKVKKDFPWRNKVRQYTNDYFIGHLKEICRVYPNVRSFWLEDDTFFAKSYSEIEDFANRYKREIHKPFCVLVSPWTYSEEKIGLLVDIGMDRLILGIQSGSENTNYNTFNRKISNSRVLDIVRSLNKFKGALPYYDFIGMNPFETRQDLMDSIQFIKRFPVPFFIFSNSLAYYPGTRIRERALEAGFNIECRDRHTDAKHGYNILCKEKMGHKFFHFILLLMGGKANAVKIGLVPRIFVCSSALKFYCFLDKHCGYLLDKGTAILSAFMIWSDWKYFLKKRLNRKQIQALKRFYHKFFK